MGDRQESWMEGYFKKDKGLGDESHRWLWLQREAKAGEGSPVRCYGWHRAVGGDEVVLYSLLSCLALATPPSWLSGS